MTISSLFWLVSFYSIGIARLLLLLFLLFLSSLLPSLLPNWKCHKPSRLLWGCDGNDDGESHRVPFCSQQHSYWPWIFIHSKYGTKGFSPSPYHIPLIISECIILYIYIPLHPMISITRYFCKLCPTHKNICIGFSSLIENIKLPGVIHHDSINS